MKKLCTPKKPFINNSPMVSVISYSLSRFSSRKIAAADAAATFPLPLAEGLAVSALVHGGVGLVGTHQDPVQRAVVLGIAVISAGLNGAFDALVGMTVHSHILL